jgi:ATP-binding cassette subfamily B protein
VSEKQEHAPSRPASPAKNKHNSKLIDNLRIVGDKLRQAMAQLSYLPRTAALVWQATHAWTAAWVGLLVVQGVLPVAVVYLTRPLVDGVLAAASSHGEWTRVRHVLLLAAAMGTVLLLVEVLRSVTAWVRTAQSELLQDQIADLIHQKSVDVDLAFYESAEYHDHLHRARSDAYHRSVAMIDSLGSLFQNGITLIAMAGVLISFGPWLTAGLIASTLPAVYVVIRYNLRLYHWRRRTTADERRAWYYDWLLTSADSAAEVRLFALGDHLKQQHRTVRQRLRSEHIELARSQSLAELGAGVLALLITAAALGSVAWRAVQDSSRWASWRSSIRPSSRGCAWRRRRSRTWDSFTRTACFWGISLRFSRSSPRSRIHLFQPLFLFAPGMTSASSM